MADIPSDADPLPIEAAREHLLHWWREPVAGIIALGVGTYDAWIYGRDDGLSASLDEALIIGGIILIAGSRKLFGPVAVGRPFGPPTKPPADLKPPYQETGEQAPDRPPPA